MRTCALEETVLAATRAMSHDALPDSVLEHLAECDGCREIHVLASSLQEERAEVLRQARVPSAGQVWWRAELRARHEAATVAARPITVVSGLAAACVVGVLASLTGVLAWWLRDVLALPAVVTELVASITPGHWALPTGMWLGVWLLAAALLVGAPVMLYVALRDE